MVFNATFNNISVISWQSVLLVEESEDLEKTTDLTQVTDKLYHIMLYTSSWSRFEFATSVLISTDCIGSCKSNYHIITTTAAPHIIEDAAVHIKITIVNMNNDVYKLSINLGLSWWYGGWIYNYNVYMQSVPITTKVVSSNPAHGRCIRYNFLW
jgi:hypothetical protein